MKSALYSNIVYPIRRHGEYIAHYTPGKRWDSLYTWDSGFIGLGMLDYSSKLAEYVMDTYLSEPDNTDFAFVAHGSLVPTQFYLYYEILNRADAKRTGKFEEILSDVFTLLSLYGWQDGRIHNVKTWKWSSDSI